MVDTSTCYSMIRGRVMRVTKLDACGAKVLGPTSTAISDGFVSVALAAQTDDGTTISVTNAAGNVCILDEPAPQFTGYEVTIEFCGVNPDLYSLITGQSVVFGSDGVTGKGFRMNTGVDADNTSFALEVWSNVPSSACQGGAVAYGYMLLPYVRGGIIGDFTVANDAVTFTLTGARTKDGTAWGVGPYNVQDGIAGVAGPLLVAAATLDHLIVFLTTIAPPASICGATQLGVPATSAVAGIPGTYLPANSYGRANFAAMTGLTASPTSAWTTGQRVIMRDGNPTYWNGTAWVAGIAP